MSFSNDTAVALQSAVALANSALEPDTMTSTEQLSAFYQRHGYTGGHARDESELAAVRSIRAELRALVTSSRDDAVVHVNRILATAGAVPRLVRHDALDWHVHAIADDAPLAQRVMVESAMAMLDMIRADEVDRLSICAASDCESVALDLSRNRSRRFCSVTCGNRAAVAAYRSRLKG